MNVIAVQTGSVAVKEGQRSGSSGQGALRLMSTLLGSQWTEPMPIYAWVIEHPEWFKPRQVQWEPEPVGPFPQSYSLTAAGDIHLVPTPGHSEGHLSVIVEEPRMTHFIAGDTSYTQKLLLKQVIDGVSLDTQSARQTLRRILTFVQNQPTIYLPSHDPESATRLQEESVVPDSAMPNCT